MIDRRAGPLPAAGGSRSPGSGRGRSRRARAWRALVLPGLVLVTGAGLSVATLPPRAERLPTDSWSAVVEKFVVRGAYHVHTNRSDGTGTLASVAEAASRAGLDFVIFTDHGDATREPEPPAYRSRVLCIDAVEISTTGGHYAALGLGRAPYPLAGDPAGVVEDVARLGGFGIATHPDSPKRSLRWREWDLPADGLEWLNADSEWRDETRRTLAGSLVHYPLRGPETLGALFDRPATTLRRWDEAGAAGRRLVVLAGADAHARLGPRGLPDEDGTAWEGERWSLPVPAYETVFRSFTTRLGLDAPLTGDAFADAEAVIDAIRRGRAFTVIDALAGPAAFEFHARGGSGIARMGDTVAPGTPLTLHVRALAPAGSRIELRRNGQVVARSAGPELSHDEAPDPEPRMYRVEVHVPRAPGDPPIPWIVSNAIYVGTRARTSKPAYWADAAALTGFEAEQWLLGRGTDTSAWRPEHGPGSSATLSTPADVAGSGLAFQYRLAPDASDAFAAMSRALAAAVEPGAVIQLRARADPPLRVSVQLRHGTADGDVRWRASAYLSGAMREILIPVATMAPVNRLAGEGDPGGADGLLVVVDRTHSHAGAAGTIWIEAATIGRGAAASGGTGRSRP